MEGGGGSTVSSNIGRICSETIFQKVFVEAKVGETRGLFSLSLSLAEEAERNRDRPKPNTPAIRRDVNL